MIVSRAAKPSSKVLSLVCFSISFFNYSTKKKEKPEELRDRCIVCVKKERFEFELCIKKRAVMRAHLCMSTKYLTLMRIVSGAWVK